MASKKVVILYYSGVGTPRRWRGGYDSIVLGSPTYFSNVAWQVKKVIDESIMHYRGGKLKGKVAGIFTSARTGRDGKDCLKRLEIALGFHHGMKVVEGIVRVDGESDREVEKRCQEYARRLVKE